MAQLVRITPYTRLVAPEVASADSCGEATRLRLFIVNVEYAKRRPAILAGDLNDVAWSRTSRQLQRTAALRDPRVGRGLLATFSANLPPGFRWPPDHVFASDNFTLCALERPGHIGSDHFPLLVDVQLQREGSHP